MDVSYDYYKVFYFVAKYKNVTHAAKVLGSNQPSISKCIGNLEKQLGCKLFVRSNRGVSLTPAAETLYAHVSVAYDHLLAAEMELSGRKSLQSGIVSVGISANTLHSVMLPVLKEFREKYPGVKLSVMSSSSPDAFQRLKEGLVDYSIVTTPYEPEKGYHKTFIREFTDYLVGGPRYAFLADSVHSLKEITEYPLVSLRKGTTTYHFYENFFKKNGVALEPDVLVASVEQLLPMIVNDLGIGFVSDFMLDTEPGNVVRIPLKEEPKPRGIYLVEDRETHLSEAANAFKSMLLEHVY